MYSSWVEILKSAILHNLAQFQKIVGRNTAIMPIVKSNAYGHGLVEIAKLISPKVKWLGAADLSEALALRKNKIKNRIFVLSYAQSRYLKDGLKQGIDLPVYDLDDARLISNFAGRLKKNAKVHIKIDTGTGRVGVLLKDAVEFIKAIKKLPNLKIEGIYSHFASAEDDLKYTTFQLKNFEKILAELKKAGIEIPIKHFACTAAILNKPQARFNLCRLGLGLYGLWPSAAVKNCVLKRYPGFELKPALSWKTKIIQIKEIAKGARIGYGGTYIAKKKMKLAVLAAGYWEGYDRRLSNKGIVIIKKTRCPVVGRVCMNLTMVDVSPVKSVKAGDEALLLGGGVTAENLAEIISTINYEVVARINPLLKRILI